VLEERIVADRHRFRPRLHILDDKWVILSRHDASQSQQAQMAANDATVEHNEHRANNQCDSDALRRLNKQILILQRLTVVL